MDKDQLSKHKSLYKVRPPWREAFKEQCVQRLKSSRRRLVDKFRGHGQGLDEKELTDLMEEEWENLCQQKRSLPGLLGSFTDLDGVEDPDFEDILALMEEIKSELVEEEKSVMADDYVLQETAALESEMNLMGDEVLCPLCRKCALSQTGSIIVCSCGLNIDTKQDGLTILDLKKNLHEGLSSHEEQCSHSPSFSLLRIGEITNLAITCDACNFMYIAI